MATLRNSIIDNGLLEDAVIKAGYDYDRCYLTNEYGVVRLDLDGEIHEIMRIVDYTGDVWKSKLGEAALEAVKANPKVTYEALPDVDGDEVAGFGIF